MSIETNIRPVTPAEAKKLPEGYEYAWSVTLGDRFIGGGYVPTMAHVYAAIAECKRLLDAEESP